MIAASLKHGLTATPARRRTSFPRSYDRGLIEAIWPIKGADWAATHFRDHMIAASLKHPKPRLPRPAFSAFPRSYDRGLIEAAVWRRRLSMSFAISAII